MDIPSKFVSKEVEDKWYAYWQSNQFFKSLPDKREPYTIVIPPPNVTGVLHMGHMLNNTIQDVLIRRARLKDIIHVGFQEQIMHQLQLRQKL